MITRADRKHGGEQAVELRSSGPVDVGAVLRRGVIAGAAGGAAMAGFLLVVGERSIRQALAIEAARAQDEPSVEVFSRGVQLFGGVLAALIFGAAVGAIFGIVFAATRRHSRLSDDFSRALAVGGVGFVTLVLVPALKYPANPPAVGDPGTINQRTAAYLTFMAASVLLSLLTWRTARWLRSQGLQFEERLPVLGVLYAAVVGVALVVWPANPDEVTAPATLIWQFRLASLGGAMALWAVLSVVFGWMSLAAQRRRAAELELRRM